MDQNSTEDVTLMGLRLVFFAVVVGVMVAACNSSDCNAAYGACNISAQVSMQRFDASRGCNEVAAAVPGVCLSSVFDTAAGCSQSASLAPECGVAPNGDIYVLEITNDEYLSGQGWRSTHQPSFATMEPPTPSATDAARCAVALCSPSCDGAASTVHPIVCPSIEGGAEE